MTDTMLEAVDNLVKGVKENRQLVISWRENNELAEEVITARQLQDAFGKGRDLIWYEVSPKSVPSSEIRETTPIVGQIKAILADRRTSTSAEKIRRIAEIILTFEKQVSDENFMLNTYDK